MDNVTTQPTDNSSFNLLTPLITPVLFVMFNHLGVTRQVLSAIREKLLQGCVSNINAHIYESEQHHFLMFLLKVNCVFYHYIRQMIRAVFVTYYYSTLRFSLNYKNNLILISYNSNVSDF